MGDILYLVHRVPYPPDRGDKIASFAMLRALARRGRVHLIAFAETADDLGHEEALGQWTASRTINMRSAGKVGAMLSSMVTGTPLSVRLFASPVIHDAVSKVLATQPIDTIVAFSSQMAQYVPADIGGRRFIMDFVDYDSRKFAAYADKARPPMRWIYRREARLLRAYEGSIANRADASLFITPEEAALFRQDVAGAHARVAAIPSVIDVDRFDPAGRYDAVLPRAGGDGPLVLFTGQMDYRPNIEAVDAFARSAWPLVRVAKPAARFAIVGRAPTPAVRALGALPGVVVTGAVPDVRGWLAAADVVVAPLLIARGVQTKVLEAMAMARPVVASPAAYEGIDAEPDRHLAVASGPGAQAGAVLALLDDPARAAAMGRAARERIAECYSQARLDARLDEILADG